MTEVVAADLLPGERIDLHRAVRAGARAARIRAARPAAQLAHHWYEAGDAEQALDASVAAAWASRRGARLHRGAPALAAGCGAAAARGRRAARGGARSTWTARPGPPSSAATTTRPCGCSTSSSTDPGPDGMAAALLHARKGSALRAAGRVTEAAQSYEVRRRAAARVRRRGRAGAGARRAQRRAAAVAGVRGRAHGRAAGVGAGPRGGCAHRRGAGPGRARASASPTSRTPTAAPPPSTRRVAVAEGTGEPEAIIEAHVRRAELLAGPLNRLDEGIAYARTGLERMRELGLARTAGVGAAHLRGQRAVPAGASGRRPQSAVAEAWELRPSGAAALDVRLARCRIDIARGASTTPRPTWRPSSCWPARPPARASASRCSCCSPRSRCGAVAPEVALATRRGRAHRGRGGRGRHPGRGPAGVARRRGRGPTW